jgi:hypothetical protein
LGTGATIDTVTAAMDTQVLLGLGGVGKTQLAADYAHTLWDARQVDLLAWITATSRDAIASAYVRLAGEVTGIHDDDAEKGSQRLLAWLAVTDKRWLIILDDIQAPADLRGLWPPHTSAGRVVVTTRRRDAALTGDGRRLVDVGLFTQAESVAYLTAKLATRPMQADGAATLSTELGYLPLALAQAAAYVADRPRLNCEGYRTRLTDRQRRLAQLLPDTEALPDDHHTTVSAAWSLSIERADRMEPAGLARPLLELASILDPNGIPLSVFTASATGVHLTSITRRRVESDAVSDALSCLHRLNLITLDPDTSDRTVRVHALVQRATREALDADHIGQVARTAADALMEVWPTTERDVDLAGVLRANADTLHHTTDTHLWQPEPHKILFHAGRSLGEAGLPAAAIAHFQKMHAVADRLLPPDHRRTLSIRHNLAYWTGESGDVVGAIAQYENLLNDCLRVLGPHHRETVATRANLARWQGHAGNHDVAVEQLEYVLAVALRVLPPDNRWILSIRHNLAYNRGRADDQTGALAQLEYLLADCVRVLGPDHLETLIVRNNLIRQRGDAGDVAIAVEMCEALLADCLRVLGPDHPRTLSVRRNLARCTGEAGDPAGAVEMCEALLADCLRVLGPDHPRTVTTSENLVHWRETLVKKRTADS